jgi:hypothetical protein
MHVSFRWRKHLHRSVRYNSRGIFRRLLASSRRGDGLPIMHTMILQSMHPIGHNNRRGVLYRLWSLLLLAALFPLPAAGLWLCSDGSRCLSCPSDSLLPATPPQETCGGCPRAGSSLTADESSDSTDCRTCCRYVLRENPAKLSSIPKEAFGSADAALTCCALPAPAREETARHRSTPLSLFNSHLPTSLFPRAPPLPA